MDRQYEGPNRRKRNIPVTTDRRKAKVQNIVTSWKEYSDDEREFLEAIDRYKRERRKPYPDAADVLVVIRSLGYRKTAEPTDLPRFYRQHEGAPSKRRLEELN